MPYRVNQKPALRTQLAARFLPLKLAIAQTQR